MYAATQQVLWKSRCLLRHWQRVFDCAQFGPPMQSNNGAGGCTYALLWGCKGNLTAQSHRWDKSILIPQLLYTQFLLSATFLATQYLPMWANYHKKLNQTTEQPFFSGCKTQFITHTPLNKIVCFVWTQIHFASLVANQPYQHLVTHPLLTSLSILSRSSLQSVYRGIVSDMLGCRFRRDGPGCSSSWLDPAASSCWLFEVPL